MNAENENPKCVKRTPIEKFVRTGPDDVRCPNCGQVALRCRPIDPTAKPNDPHLRICCGVSFDTRDLWEAQCARTKAATENSKVLAGLEATEIHGGVALTYFGVPISVDLRSASEMEMARAVIPNLVARVNGLERLLAGKDALLTRERATLSRINAEREQSLTEATHFRGQRDELISAIGAHQVYGDATFSEALKMAKDMRHMVGQAECADGDKENPLPFGPVTRTEGVPEALEYAWGIIANASGGDWSKETAEWREAAEKWRDEFYGPSVTRHAEPSPFSAGTAMAEDTARLQEKLSPPKLFISPPPFQRVEPLPPSKSEGLTMDYVQILEKKCAILEVRATAAEQKQRTLLQRCDDRDEVIDNERQKVREWMGERDELAKRVLTLNEKIDSLAKQLVAKDAELGLLESRFVNLRALAAQIVQTAQL